MEVVLLWCVRWVETKSRDVVLKIFLAPTGVTQCNLRTEFVCGLREHPPGSFLRQSVSVGRAPG